MKAPSLSGIDPRSTVLAIDIGGTKLACGIVDQTGVVTHRHEVPTAIAPTNDLFEHLLELVTTTRTAHEQVADAAPIIAVGVGCGGPMDTHLGRVSPGNIGNWRDYPLREQLCEALQLPTFLDNDAKALALGEGWVGSAQHSNNFMAMVVSTGVGGGVVLDGRLLDGRLGNAGHVGHIIAVPGGRLCSCGAHGCLEAEASGPSIAAFTGEPPAQASLEVRIRTGRLVGRTISSVVNLLDLDLVIVAGSVALGFGEPFFTAAQREIQHYAHMDYARNARVVPAKFSANSPLIGAGAVAWYGLDHHTGAPTVSDVAAGELCNKSSFPTSWNPPSNTADHDGR